mgnify:CR=1 FL=1|tara:strand:+ start:1152 stop:1373 length:222 start_codon:yes stop_codon:yes gene_type:complete
MNDTYDAGYLPNDEDCDQDSIRVELAYSHDFYSSIIESKDDKIAELEKWVGYLRHRLSPFEAAEKLDNLLKIS